MFNLTSDGRNLVIFFFIKVENYGKKFVTGSFSVILIMCKNYWDWESKKIQQSPCLNIYNNLETRI